MVKTWAKRFHKEISQQQNFNRAQSFSFNQKDLLQFWGLNKKIDDENNVATSEDNLWCPYIII